MVDLVVAVVVVVQTETKIDPADAGDVDADVATLA